MNDAEFVDFVSSFYIVFCSETWQTADDNYDLPGYECICAPRPESVASNRKSNRGHGGICVFIRDTISDSVSIVVIDNEGFVLLKLKKMFLVSKVIFNMYV